MIILWLAPKEGGHSCMVIMEAVAGQVGMQIRRRAGGTTHTGKSKWNAWLQGCQNQHGHWTPSVGLELKPDSR